MKEVIVCTGKQRLPGLAAEIAYSAALAMFPATLALLTAIGLVASSQAAFGEMAKQLSWIAPGEVLEVIQRFIQEVSPGSSRSLLSISFLGALWAASGAVNSTMNALDRIHQVPLRQLRPFWKAKLVSIILTVGTILLLVAASTVVFVSDVIIKIVVAQSDQLVEAVAKRPSFMEPQLLRAWQRLSMPLALSMVAIAFAFIYRFGPSRWHKNTPILPGAFLATLAWAVCSKLFSLYVTNFGNYNRIYGAVGAVIVVLLWLQLGALTLLIGAQLNFTVGRAMHQKPNSPNKTRPNKYPIHRELSNRAQYRQQHRGNNQTPKNPPRHKAQ
ncbi:YihY/virulence factor BrkB family protein [Leptolyngbyaceae cyanobacterium UHCC 1019]